MEQAVGGDPPEQCRQGGQYELDFKVEDRAGGASLERAITVNLID